MAVPSLKIETGDRRADERTPIERAAVLRIDGQAHAIEVDNLTRDGCKIRTTLDLAPGLMVTIGLAGVGTVSARVVWRSASGYGCAFEQSLPAGAVTAATRNNVAHLGELTLDVPIVMPAQVKWSRRRSLALVAGASALLWVGLIGGYLLAR